MEYLKAEKPAGCVFCKDSSRMNNLVLLEGETSFVMMNLYPYNNGHLMVVPYRHVYSITELSDEETLDLMKMTQQAVRCLKEAFRPEGFNIGVNIGKVAGAGIEEHLHFHIIPRWVGDTHFMAILGEVRVIPEHVLSTYDKLFPLFGAATA